ncbi:MAG TPA: helix-turn-helix transcriptional regulator [Bryobacteraceae bacterium]|nr:helix-turn-helix transcriptional regulator [Bryobacteraceae bacterium]
MPELAAVVKAIRMRRDESQAEFSRFLGCSQNSVSRYESGEVVPNPAVLLQLHHLAADDEKPLFRAHISRMFQAGRIRGCDGMTEEQIIDLFRPGNPELGIRAETNDLMYQFALRDRDENFRQFVAAFVQITRSRGVDASLTEILRLYVDHSTNPKAAEYFRDALGFLRTRLLSGADSPK